MSQIAKVAEGDVVTYVNNTGGALTVGAFVRIGCMVGLLSDAGIGTTGPNTTLANGATGRVTIRGAVEGPKVSAAGGAIKACAPAFWDAANSRFDPRQEVAGVPNMPAGIFQEDAAEAASRCKVILNVVPVNYGAGVGRTLLASKKAASASGDTIVFTNGTGIGLRLVDWWLISRTTGAANVKLKNGSTDMTAVVAKGTADDTIVRGGTIVEAQEVLAAGAVLNVNLSAAEEVDVFALFETE